MQRLVEIFRRATVSPSAAKNPLTAGAAERREWQYEDTSNQPEVLLAKNAMIGGKLRPGFGGCLGFTVGQVRASSGVGRCGGGLWMRGGEGGVDSQTSV